MINLVSLSSLTSNVPWGLWAVLYIVLIGISASSAILVALGIIGRIKQVDSFSRFGLNLALSSLAIGLLCILIDIGHMERFLNIIFQANLAAPMGKMFFIYTGYGLLLLSCLLLVKRGLNVLVGVVLGVVALAVLLFEVTIFYTSPGKDWQSFLFVLHFLVGSFAVGIPVLLLFAKKFQPKLEISPLPRKLLISALIVLVGIDVIGLSLHGGILPLVLPSIALLLAAIFLIRKSANISEFGLITALLGALISKYHSVVGTLLKEPFSGYIEAFSDSRLHLSWAPNIFELLVSLVAVALFVGIFIFLQTLFPLTKEEN